LSILQLFLSYVTVAQRLHWS